MDGVYFYCVLNGLEPPYPLHFLPPKETTETTVTDLLQEINKPYYTKKLKKLSTWNRWNKSSDMPAVRDWLQRQFERLGYVVTREKINVKSNEGYNIIATCPERSPESLQEWYIIGAHYDSTSENPAVAAPGAVDNASGSIGVLEMARIFAKYKPISGALIFILFDGEEAGLHGSKNYVNGLTNKGHCDNVKFVSTMDMIAYNHDFQKKRSTKIKLTVETYSKYSSILNEFQDLSYKYTPNVVIEPETEAWGSDHMPFLKNSIPAFLLISDDIDNYPDYHRTSDKFENCSVDVAIQVLTLNIAMVAKSVGYTLD
eukprot:TRINITY_DN1341_c0_g1_i1.p1 TRINITY_DN1341_c0_g1~~TRINITY_DN1341_c0_g1_i1.p1  ORF type:complete len:314 (+),score=37.50 TRINITY_DN1341_c0_g1_i1:54-995(+)